MVQGAFDSFLLRNIHMNTVLQYLEAALQQMQFQPMERVWFGYMLRGRSMWGSTGKAYVVSAFVPFGDLFKEGNRYGAEFEVQPWGNNVVLRMLIAPYMTFFDRRDIFILSQGILEHYTDERHCREFMNQFVHMMSYMGMRMDPYRGQQ